jgi:hypothetical protein
MNRQTANARQRKPGPPEPQRGPGQSIGSAQTFGVTQQQQQQQQMLQQQRMQQQKQAANGKNASRQIPAQVTIQQAVAVIVSRLNKLEIKSARMSSTSVSGDSVPQTDDSSNNELDQAMAQIFERLHNLESSDYSASSEDLSLKITKLENDLRDSKDIIMKLQSFTIDTTKQMSTLTAKIGELTSNVSLLSTNVSDLSVNVESFNSSIIPSSTNDEPLVLSLKEILRNEIIDETDDC